MKKLILFQLLIVILFSCRKNDDEGDIDPQYKQKMREFVIGISQYAKSVKPSFAIIPQNGIELVTSDGETNGPPDTPYLDAIDGHGQEDLFFGYDNDNVATPVATTTYLRTFLDISKNAGNTILVTDYCSTQSNMTSSYSQNNEANYVSFAADVRELNQIPSFPNPIYGVNNSVVTKLSDVKNFLYLLNPESYTTKTAFINAITATNYDLLIMDLFFQDGTEFTAAEINQLKNKANGGKRLVVSYMSIGEVEDYRYYWKSLWDSNKPAWIDSENPDWPGNFKVKYWEKDWQDIIFGNDNSYLKKILNANFDGVYLDIIDAFEFYE
jgi:cysteinyl-tRNA synthetase, unknown class